MLAAILLSCTDRPTEYKPPPPAEAEFTIINSLGPYASVVHGLTFRHVFTTSGVPDSADVYWNVTSKSETSPPDSLFRINNRGEFSFDTDTSFGGRSYLFEISATSGNLGDTLDLEVSVNGGQNYTITNCPEQIVEILAGSSWTFRFNTVDYWRGIPWYVASVYPQPHGTFEFWSAGTFHFEPTLEDGGQTYVFEIAQENSDAPGTRCQFMVQVQPFEYFEIRIGEVYGVGLGDTVEVPVYFTGGSYSIDQFNLLITYDTDVLVLDTAIYSPHMYGDDCGDWVLFVEREMGTCHPCPKDQIWLAGGNYKYPPTSESCFDFEGELARLRFIVSSDSANLCRFSPLRFTWTECWSTALNSQVPGANYCLARHVYSAETHLNIAESECVSSGYDFGGTCAECAESFGLGSQRVVDFWNGGIGITCKE